MTPIFYLACITKARKMTRLSSETITRARAITIENVIDERGFKLKGLGAERSGPCPRCDGRDRFAINTNKQKWLCRNCHPKGGGDAISLVMFLDGVGFNAACVQMTGGERVHYDEPAKPKVKPADERQTSTAQNIVATYDYTASDGTLLYQAVRYDPKDFRQRRPDGNGGWINNLESLDGKRVLYRWPELEKYPDASVFICEGEKDANRVAAPGHCATTVASGKWTDDCISPLKGRHVFIMEDNDKTGREKSQKAATALHGLAASVRVVRLPGLPEDHDVSDWLDVDPARADALVDICIGSPEWVPPTAPQEIARAKAGLDVVCIADVRPEPIDWLWPNRIALGKVHVLAGDGGKGKSTILVDLTARVTTGDKWPDGERACEAGSVIILAAEDAVEDTIAPRLIAAEAKLSRVFVIRSVIDEHHGRRSFNLQADLGRLEAEIEKHDNVRMVIIDPVTSYLGKIDSHKNADVRGVLEPLGEMAARMKVAVICNNHFNKGAGSANSKIIGSVAFVNQARAAFVVVPDEEDKTRMLLLPSKMNIAPIKTGLAYRIESKIIEHDGVKIMTSRIMFESTTVTITADQALAALDGSGNQSEKSEAIEFLTDALSKGPVLAKDMKRQAADAGISPKPLRSAREAMGIRTEKAGFASGWVWINPKVPTRTDEGARQDFWASSASSQDNGHLRPNVKVPNFPEGAQSGTWASSGHLRHDRGIRVVQGGLTTASS
jgi:hypothetical protein